MWKFLVSMALCLGVLIIQASGSSYTLSSYIAGNDPRTWSTDIFSILSAETMILSAESGVSFVSCQVFFGATDDSLTEESGTSCGIDNSAMTCRRDVPQRGRMRLVCEVRTPSVTSEGIVFRLRDLNNPESTTEFTSTQSIVESMTGTIVPSHYLAEAENTLTISFTTFFNAPAGSDLVFAFHPHVNSHSCEFSGAMFQDQSSTGAKTSEPLASHAQLTIQCVVVIGALDEPPVESFVFGGYPVVIGALSRSIAYYSISASSTGFTPGTPHTMTLQLTSLMVSDIGSQYSFDIDPTISVLPDDITCESPSDCIPSLNAENTITLEYASRRDAGHAITFSFDFKFLGNFSESVGTMRTNLISDTMERSAQIDSLPHPVMEYTDAGHQPTMVLSTYSNRDIGTFSIKIIALQQYLTGINLRVSLNSLFTVAQSDVDSCLTEPSMPITVSLGNGLISITLGDGVNILFGETFSISCSMTTGAGTLAENVSPGTVILSSLSIADQVAPIEPLNVAIGPAVTMSQPDGYLVNTGMNVAFAIQLPRYVMAGDQFVLSISGTLTMDENTECISNIVRTGTSVTAYDFSSFVHGSRADNKPHVVTFQASLDMSINDEPVFLCRILFPNIGYKGKNIAKGHFVGPDEQPLALVEWATEWSEQIRSYSASATLSSYLAGHENSNIRIEFTTLLPGEAMDLEDRGWVITLNPAFELKDLPCQFENQISGSVVANAEANEIHVHLFNKMPSLSVVSFSCQTKNLEPLEGSPATFAVDEEHFFNVNPLPVAVTHYTGQVTLSSYKTDVTSILTVQVVSLHQAANWEFKVNPLLRLQGNSPCETQDATLKLTFSNSDSYVVTVTPKSGDVIRPRYTISFTCQAKNPANPYDGENPVTLTVDTFTAALGPLPHQISSQPSSKAWLNSYVAGVETKLFVSVFLIESVPENTQFAFTLDPLYVRNGDCSVFKQPNDALVTVTGTSLKAPTGGFRTGELVLQCPVKNPDTIEENYLNAAKVKIGSASDIPSLLPFTPTLTGDSSASVTSYETSSNQQLTIYVSVPSAFKHKTDQVFVLHSAFSNVHSCEIIEATDSLIARATISVSGVTVTVTPWSEGLIMGNANYKLRCYVITPSGPIKNSPIATFKFTTADGEKQSFEVKRPDRDFAKYEASSVLLSYFEYASTNYEVSFKTLLTFPGAATLTLSFSKKLTQSGGACRIITPAGQRSQKSFSSATKNNVAVFDLPSGDDVELGNSITLRCPVKNPAASSSSFVATVKISNGFNANTEFTVDPLPLDVFASYAKAPALFESRMVRYYAEKPTTVYFQFPLLESTASGSVYNFVIDNAITFEDSASNPCKGDNLAVTQPDNDKRKVRVELTKNLASGTKIRLECNVLAPHADSEPSGSMAKVTFTAASAPQVGTFPELVSKTSIDNELTVSVQTLSRGEDNNVVFSFPVLDDLAKSTAVHLVLNQAFKGTGTCTWSDTTVDEDATKITNRFVIDFIVSKTIYAGAHASITCKFKNPNRAIGLTETPFEVFFNISPEEEVRLLHSIDIDLVPGFSGTTKLSVYTQQPVVTLTMWLAFPRAINSGELTMTLHSNLAMTSGSGCVLVNGNYTDPDIVTLKHDPPTSQVLSLAFTSFPLGGHLTIECKVSTENADQNSFDAVITSAATLDPSVSSFKIADLPFPIIGTAVAQTYLSSIISESYARLINSFWLVSPVPDATLFLFSIPKSTFEFRVCDLFDEAHSVVSLAPTEFQEDGSDYVVHTNITALPAGTRLTCECIVKLPAKGEPFSLTYGPIVMKPPDGDNIFVTVPDLPHAPIEMPPAPGPGFLSSLLFSKSQTMPLEFIIVDSITANGIIMVDVNAQFIDVVCSASAMGGLITLLPSDPTKPSSFSFQFPEGFHAGSLVRFGCQVVLPNAELTSLVAAVVSYDYEAVDKEGDNYETATRSVEFKLLSNIREKYTVSVELNTFKTNVETNLHLSYHVLDSDLTKEESVMELAVHGAVAFKENAECTGSNIRGSKITPVAATGTTGSPMTLLEVKVNLDAFLGQEVTIVCPIKTPSSEGSLDGPLVSLKSIKPVMSVDIRNPPYPFVETFETTTQLSSIRPGNAIVHFHFWLYEAAGSEYDNLFTIPIKTAMIESVKSCVVEDENGSDDIFENLEIGSAGSSGGNDLFISFNMALSERAGQSVTLSCNVVITENEDEDMPLEVGPATLAGWTISFPPLPHHPVQRYDIVPTFSSFYGNQKATISFSFLLLSELTSRNNFVLIVDPDFIGKKADTPCTAEPDIFNIMSPYAGAHRFEVKTNMHVFAGTTVLMGCDFILRQHISAPFTPAYFTIGSSSTPYPSRQVDVSVEDSYSGTFHFSSLLRNRPSKVTLTFVALEGLKQDTPVTVTFKAPVSIASDAVCDFEGMTVSEISPGADISSVTLVATNDISPGTKVTGLCNVLIDNNLETISVLSFQFPHSATETREGRFMSNIQFDLSPSYVVESVLDNYNPGVETSLHLSMVVLEDIFNDTLDVVPTSSLFSGVTCESKSHNGDRQSSAKFFFTEVKAGETVLFSCTVTTKATSGPAGSPAMITRTTSAAAPAGQALQIPAKGLTLPISKESGLNSHLSSFLASSQATMELEMNLLQSIPANSTNVRSEVLLTLPPAFEPTSCHFDDFVLSITGSIASFFPKRKINAGRRILISCNLNTPLSSETFPDPVTLSLLKQSPLIVFPAFLQQQTFDNYFGLARLADYTISKSTLFTLSFVALTGLVQSDSVSFGVPTLSLSSCSASGSGRPIATVDFSASTLTLNFGAMEEDEVAVQAGGLVTVSCSVTNPEAPTPLTTVTSNSNIIGGSQTTITFDSFPMNIVATMPLTSYLKSYYAGSPSLFVIEFQPVLDLAAETRIEWSDPTFTGITCTLFKQAPGDDEFVKINSPIVSAVSGGTQMRLSCYLRTLSAGLPLNLSIQAMAFIPPAGASTSFPLAKLLTTFKSAPEVTENLKLWYLAASTESYITTTFKTLQYYFPGDEITITVGKAFSKPSSDAFSTILIDSESSNSSAEQLEWIGQKLTYVVAEIIPADTPIHLSIAVLNPSEDDDFTGIASVVNITQGSEHIYSYEIGKDVTISDEKFSAELSTYYSGAPSVTATVTFMITEVWQASTANPALYEFFYDPDSGTSCAIDAATSSDSSLEWTKQSSTISSSSQTATIGTTVTVIFTCSPAMPVGTTSLFTSVTFKHPSLDVSYTRPVVLSEFIHQITDAFIGDVTTSNYMQGEEAELRVHFWAIMPLCSAGLQCPDVILMKFGEPGSGVTIADPEENCRLHVGTAERVPQCTPGTEDLCNNKGVRFNLERKVDAGVSMRIVCKNVRNPPTAGFGPIVVKGTLGSLTFAGSASDKFKFIRVPTYLSALSPLETKVRLTTYRQEASSTMIMSWMMVTDMASNLVITLRSGLFTNVDECSAEDDIGQGKGDIFSSIVSTKDKITFNGFKSFGGSTIVLKCSVKTGKQGTELSAGSMTVNGMAYHFTLPMRIVDSYDGTVSLSSLTAHESAVVTFEFLTFADFMGRTFSILPGIFSEEDAALVSCTSDFSSASSFTNITFTENTLPDSMITVTCTGPLGTKGSYDVTATISGEDANEEEDYTFGSVTIVDMVDVFFETDSRVASDNCSFTISFIAPIAMDGYSVVFTTADWFSDVEDCSTGFGTIELSEPASDGTPRQTNIKVDFAGVGAGTEVVISCHVTNTIASRARFSSGDFAIQSGPNIMFEGSFASIYSDLGGVLTRDSTIEGSMTTFTMMFDAPDMSATDRVVLKINTGTTIRNLTSGCDISTLSPDQSLSTSIGVLSESSVSGFEIEFEGSVITSLSSLTMVCEGQNGDHQTNVMWDAAYWIRGSSRLPVVFAPFDIESSTVFGEILLSTTRAGRLDIPVKIVFSSRLPVAGYSLEFDLADILTSFGENCNEVTQVIGGGPVKVGDVVVSDTKLSLSFLDLAKVDSQFLISCQCNLGDEAENNNPLVSTFEPPSANLPSFIFSLELPNIVDVVKITAALSVYYVQASSKLTVPILPPENFANWIFSINFGTTFQSVSSCTVKDEDGNSVIVENSMTVMSDESSSVKFTFHSDELTSLALLVCDVVNGERSEVKWSASAELSGMPSFEFEVTMSPIVHTPPEIDAVLSSSVFNDVPVTLTLEFVLTFDLNATDSLSFNLFDLFKMDKISCSLTSSADADRKPFHSSATAGSEWEITFAYFETSAIAAGAKLTVVCENLRNPANSAAIVPVTGRLADGVPLVFSVSNEFVDQAPAGTVTTTSYTAGTKDELMTFTFKPPRDLKDYVARIESKPHFDLLNDCRLTEGSSQSQVAHEGPTPVRTILMTILSSTVIGQDTSFLCDVNLGIPAPAGTIEIAFSNTVNSNEIVIPFSIREYVPAPDFTGSFSSSLLGDKNVYAKFTATAGFTIPANAKLYFGFPTSFATIACDLIFGSTTQRLTRNAEVFPFTVSEPIPVSTTLTLECTSISLPATAGFSLSSRIETEAFGTIPFSLSYTNDMRKEYAEGKAILDSYLPEVQTTLHATIVPLKNLKSTTLRLNMLDKKDNANSGPLFGFIQSCDNFDGKFSSTPQAGGLTAIDITVNVDTEVDVPLTLVCDVTTNVATNADGFIALELIGSSGTAETTVHLAINAIIKSLEGTLSLTSTVSGEPSTATFIVSNFDSDFETTKLVADLSTMAYSVENCSVPVNTESYATVSMDFPFVTMVFNTKLEGQSLSWSCDIINGTPEDSYTVTVKATDPAKPSSNLPLYFPHPGIQARLLTAAAAEFNGPRSAGSRTSIVFTAKPNFAVSGTMIFAFPIPEHASNTTSDWPLTCSATVNSASVSSLTFSTVPFAFTFSGVSATMTGAEIVFTCINFPLPLTPFITPTPILAATLHDIDAIDAFLAGDAPNATNGIIAVLETSFPAYPASTDSDFGGRLAHIEYVSSTPNSFTGVRFSAAPTILTTIAKDTIVRAELAYGVSLRSSDVSCTLSSGEYTISGRTTSALRTPQGVIVIEWEAGAASPLDPDTQVDFLCESVVLPADLMDPQHYGSLTVGSMTVTKMITDEIKSAPLSDITSTFTPNQIGTPSAVFAISHIGIDLVPGNTIVLPVPGSTIQTKDTAITCRFDGGLAISALLDVSRSHLTLIVPKDLNVPPSASLACAGLQPPQSTLARIGNSAFLHIYASSAMHIEELIGNGTVASPIISPRIFDNDDTMLTIISDESDTPASFFVRKATVELSVAALPFDVFASSARVTLKVPSDMFFTGTCKFGNIDEDNYDPNRIPVDVSTTDGVALFTFARSMSQYIPSIKKSNTAQIYRITCPPAAVTLPDYILEDQSTLTVDVSASIGDKISSTTTGRIRGGPSPDIGAVTVSTAPWLGQTGGFVVSWDMHSIRFAPSDVVIIDMEMDGQYVFNTPRCSVLEPPADITVVATQSSIELTFGDFVDPAPDHRFLISCPSVLVPSNLGEEPQSPGSLRVLRNGDPTQLKINAPDSVSFTVLTPEPNDLVEIDVTFEPPSDMSGSKGTAKINLFSSEIEIPAQAILSMSIPRTMWSFPDPLECTGSVAGSAASTVVDSSTQITFTFGDNVPKNTKFVLSCRNARATAVYRAGATVSAIVRLNGKEIAMDKSIEIPPLLGVVGVGASIVFLAPTTGAVGTVDVDVPEIAATIVGAITIVVSVPPGTFMSDDTSVCTATTSGGEATVLAAVIATDDATFTSALAATIDVGSSLTIGASVSFSCTNVRSTFIPTPAAVDGPENPYVVYVHLADGSPAARGAVSFGGIKAITELSEMDVSFSTTAGARAGLVITLAAPGFALPVNSRFSLRIAKEAARVDGATRCAINGRFDALLEPVDADDEGAVAIVAAEEVPSSVEIIEVLCPNAFDLPNYEVKWTSTRMKLMLPYGENSTLVDTFDLDVPHSGVLPAVLSVSVSPADARVAIKSELVFSILPTSLDAVANDVLEVTGPVLFDYIVDKKATCELQGEKGSTKTKIDISTVDNSDGVHTSYTLSFPNGLKLSGRDRVIISCGPVTTPSRALAEMQTAVVLRNTATGSGARIRGSAAKGAVFTAITPISFGNRWSRIKPQSTVAGSGFGDLTIVLSPITANLPIRSTFVVTLPSTWTVTTNAFGCSASFGSALVSDSTIPMIASAPQVTPAESKVIRITSSQLAIARSSQIFRIFCSNAVRVPSIEAPSVEGPFISVFDASNMPLMQAPQVQLPAITAGASPVPIVMTRVMTAIPAQRRGGEFKITGKDAEVLHVVFANALNIPLTNAVVRSVLVGNDGITFDMALVPTASTSIEDIMDKITERGPALLSQLKSTMRMPVQSVQLPSETTLRATCADGLRNGDETDVDCGGASCLPCAETRTCSAAKDCELATCTSGRCAGRVNSAAGGASAMVAIAAAVIASIIMCMV